MKEDHNTRTRTQERQQFSSLYMNCRAIMYELYRQKGVIDQKLEIMIHANIELEQGLDLYNNEQTDSKDYV